MSDAPAPPRRFVEALQSPGSVVTYRAVVGFFVVVITGLLGFFGSQIVTGQEKLNDLMVKVQLALSHQEGRQDEQGHRLDADEARISNLDQAAGNLDHRVTVIEAKQGLR